MGRPKSIVITRQQQEENEINEVKDNINLTIDKLKEIGNSKVCEDGLIVFACPNCGEISKDKFIRSNNEFNKVSGRIIYCVECLKKIYETAYDKYDDEKKAIVFMCQKIDIPYSERLYAILS